MLFVCANRASRYNLVFGAERRPFSDKVIGLFARGAIVVFWSYPHGHVSFIRAYEKAFAEFTYGGYVNIVLLESQLDFLFQLKLFK